MRVDDDLLKRLLKKPLIELVLPVSNFSRLFLRCWASGGDSRLDLRLCALLDSEFSSILCAEVALPVFER